MDWAYYKDRDESIDIGKDEVRGGDETLETTAVCDERVVGIQMRAGDNTSESRDAQQVG